MRRMGRSVSFGHEFAPPRAGGAHARHVQGLIEVQVRSPRPIPETETSQRYEIFLCFRECASPWECSDMLPARTRTVSRIRGSIQMLRADASARAIKEPEVPLGVPCLCRVLEFSRFCPICVAESRARGLSTQVCPSLDSLSPNRTASCRSPVQRRQVKAPNGSQSARVGRR